MEAGVVSTEYLKEIEHSPSDRNDWPNTGNGCAKNALWAKTGRIRQHRRAVHHVGIPVPTLRIVYIARNWIGAEESAQHRRLFAIISIVVTKFGIVLIISKTEVVIEVVVVNLRAAKWVIVSFPLDRTAIGI